jgi:hypothetical protein
MSSLKAHLQRFRLTHWSTYSGFTLWGAAGFGFQPSLGAFVTHFAIIPALLILTIFLARKGH